jgi:hypothetical protein
VPRTGRNGAGGKAWRHISQSGRIPPDRRLTDNIGSEDGGQPALQRRPPFTDKLAIKAGRIQPVQKTLECLLLARSEHACKAASGHGSFPIQSRSSSPNVSFPTNFVSLTLGSGPVDRLAPWSGGDPKQNCGPDRKIHETSQIPSGNQD